MCQPAALWLQHVWPPVWWLPIRRPGVSAAWRAATPKALEQARHLVYVEDQYPWSAEVSSVFAEALRRQPGLQLIAVLPPVPDEDGRLSKPPNLIGRQRLRDDLETAGPGRVALYGIENA